MELCLSSFLLSWNCKNLKSSDSHTFAWSESLGGLLKDYCVCPSPRNPNLADLQWGWRRCVSDRFPCDAFAVCLGSKLQEALLWPNSVRGRKGEEHFVIEEEKSLCATGCRLMRDKGRAGYVGNLFLGSLSAGNHVEYRPSVFVASNSGVGEPEPVFLSCSYWKFNAQVRFRTHGPR